MTIPRPCKDLSNYILDLNDLFKSGEFHDPVYDAVKQNERQRIEFESEYFSTMRSLYCKHCCENSCEYHETIELAKICKWIK